MGPGHYTFVKPRQDTVAHKSAFEKIYDRRDRAWKSSLWLSESELQYVNLPQRRLEDNKQSHDGLDCAAISILQMLAGAVRKAARHLELGAQ